VSGGVLCVVAAVAVTLALPLLWRYDGRAERADEPGGGVPLAQASGSTGTS
jgi:hypothetical protein